MTEIATGMKEDLNLRILHFLRVECELLPAIDGTTVPKDDLELLAVIGELVEVAENYRIDTERGFAFFVLLALSLARNFHELPLFSEIMTNIHETPIENLKLVAREAIFYHFGDT